LAADDGPTAEELQAFADQIGALAVDTLVLSSVSTFLTVGQAKLDRAELADAKKAIDAALALLPQVPEEGRRALEPALAQLQVAYAAAASG
jgi:hypothetical protein